MSKVFIYGFVGKFNGDPEYDYNHPEPNAVHKCMLFLAQNSNEPSFDTAIDECLKFGFEEITNLQGNELQVEVLSTELYRGFAAFYEEALEEGSALVYYPNT